VASGLTAPIVGHAVSRLVLSRRARKAGRNCPAHCADAHARATATSTPSSCSAVRKSSRSPKGSCLGWSNVRSGSKGPAPANMGSASAKWCV
jgi:hypothetical protein